MFDAARGSQQPRLEVGRDGESEGEGRNGGSQEGRKGGRKGGTEGEREGERKGANTGAHNAVGNVTVQRWARAVVSLHLGHFRHKNLKREGILSGFVR